MGSKAEYERRKQERKTTKAILSLSSEPDKINVMINYCDELVIQKMLLVHAEKRTSFIELTERRDALFDQLDHRLNHPTTVEFRVEQVHALMNTLFGEVIARVPSKDFPIVTELAIYLIAKRQPAEEIASARGYIITIAGDFLDITCCQSDDACTAGLNAISEKFIRERGYKVTMPLNA